MGIENKVMIEDDSRSLKYIVVSVRGDNNSPTLVAKACPMSGPIQIAHRDIFAGYQNSTEDYWAKALGGGRLWIGNGKLVAFDFSGDYGPADETIVRLLLMPYCQTKNLELILRNKASRWDCPEIDQK